ncbi:MAG: hypothetical protein AMJ41_01285 [candidate division Zixibacteria bacterium DG_27]|nr:MAG: hypothetical protein AMJ41_01285 [candidate division Zixibacteria bacterium DG_27]
MIEVKRYVVILIVLLTWSLLPRPASSQTSEEYGFRVTPLHPGPELEIEVWTNKGRGGTFYLGEDVVVYFRTNMDCYVLLYEIDTEGYLHLIYPHDPYEDCSVSGEVTYRVPNPDRDYRFRICGPPGEELLYAVASPHPISPPRWLPYRSEGEYDPSWCAYLEEERFDLIDKANFKVFEDRYFVSDWCVFEIEDVYHHYYRPRDYYRYWPVGTVWVDCSWYGGEIFIDGVFWGYAPMCIPNIFIGPHIIIVYYNGYPCWQRYVYVERYRPVRVKVGYTGKFERRRYKGDYFRDYDWGGKKYKDRPPWASPETSPSEGKFTRRDRAGSKSTYTPPEKTTLAKSSEGRYIKSKSVRSTGKVSAKSESVSSGVEKKKTVTYSKPRTLKAQEKEKSKETKSLSGKSRSYSRSENGKERSTSTIKTQSVRVEKGTSSQPESSRTKAARRR